MSQDHDYKSEERRAKVEAKAREICVGYDMDFHFRVWAPDDPDVICIETKRGNHPKPNLCLTYEEIDFSTQTAWRKLKRFIKNNP
jgi:hypothetical protein